MSLLQHLAKALIVLAACGGSTAPSTPVPPGAARPEARFGHAMAFHAGTGKVLLFGGERIAAGRGRLGDSWEWDGAAWTRVATSGPPPRMDIAMAYDSGRDRVVVFGGNGANAVTHTDTWEWDGRAWAKRDDAAPGMRIHPVMAYDAARRRVVLFGGAGSQGWLTDTWEWDGTRWEQRATTGPAFVASAAYDPSRNAVVALTVPAQDGSPANGMVAWNGSQWTPIATPSVPPVEPLEPLVAAAPPNQLMIYRSSYRGGPAETWFWNGATWTRDSGAAPGPLLAYAAAFDARRQRMVLFGGLRPGEIVTDGLWERGANGWQQLP